MWRHVALVRDGRRDPEAAVAWRRVREGAEKMGNIAAQLDAAEGIARSTRRIAPAEAIGRYEEALALAARAGDRLREAAILNTLGILDYERGDYASALRRYETGLAMARVRGDRGHEGLMLNSIGVTLTRLQRHEEARTALDEALVVNRQSRQRLLESHTFAALGDLAQGVGRFEAAVEYFGSSLAIRRELDDQPGADAMRQRLASVRAAAGERES